MIVCDETDETGMILGLVLYETGLFQIRVIFYNRVLNWNESRLFLDCHVSMSKNKLSDLLNY